MRVMNARGAAFLLAVYFASLMLFLLGGVSLQRTMTEVRAAQTSRDLQQAFWAGEAAFDKALSVLHKAEAPQFDDLGCVYENIRLPGISMPSQTNSTAISGSPHNGSYMICKATLSDGSYSPDQFDVQMLGITRTGTPVWISAFVKQELASVTLGQAIVGIDGVTVTHGTVGGVDTNDAAHPITLASAMLFGGLPNTTLADAFGDLVPQLAGAFSNQGHIATKSASANAIRLFNNSVIHGDILGRTPSSTAGGTYDAAAAGNMVALPEFPGVQTPHVNAWSLADTLLPSVASTDADGNVTIVNHWAAVSAGTYYAKSLTLRDASFSTVGPVNLFVDGPVTVTRSVMYGQKTADQAAINTMQFVPANLRVFVAPTGKANQQVLIQKGSMVAGVVYAPEVPLKVTRKSLVVGALVGKQAQVGLLPTDAYAYVEAGNGTKVYFDQSVAGITLHPQPENPDPNVLFYRVRQSLSEASVASTRDAARLERWFQFTGLSAAAAQQTVSSGKENAGSSWGGGCSVSCHTFGSC